MKNIFLFLLFLPNLLFAQSNDNNPSTQFRIAFEKAIILQTQKFQDSINYYRTAANFSRRQLDNCMKTLEYDPIFVIGESGHYYTEGMSKLFNAAPEGMKIFLYRNPLAKQLEQAHIKVYNFDVKILKTQQNLNDMSTKKENIFDMLSLNFSELNESEQKKLKEAENLEKWLVDNWPIDL